MGKEEMEYSITDQRQLSKTLTRHAEKDDVKDGLQFHHAKECTSEVNQTGQWDMHVRVHDNTNESSIELIPIQVSTPRGRLKGSDDMKEKH